MIRYFFNTILLVSLLIFGCISYAQDAKVHPSSDSVIIASPEEQALKNKSQRFSVIQPQDKTPVNSRQISEADVNKLKQDDAFWYADYKPQPRPVKKAGNNFFNSVLTSQWLKIILFIIFATAILWLVVSGDYKFFRKPSKTLQQKNADAGDNIFETDFEAEISDAIAANDFPQAIRLHYLQVLKELANKNIIQYSPDHTNLDFVQQLKKSRYYNDFFFLTRSFEYSWYGKLPVSEPAFKEIRSKFILFKQQVSG